MDPLIAAAARALAAGDPLSALKRVALRDDPPALALRGIAMAQLSEYPRARKLLRAAARGFGPGEAASRARCLVAEAEIALVSRDLGRVVPTLGAARAALAAHGDRANAAHAGYIEARRLLLIGELDEAARTLDALDAAALPPASRTGAWLVAAGIAMRRTRARSAQAALDRAAHSARISGIASLAAEVEHAAHALAAPAARLIAPEGTRPLGLAEVEALFASDALVFDACRAMVRAGTQVVRLAGRPVLFALARALAEAWPGDASRALLVTRAFRAREADESHRARLRVEIGRLRRLLLPLPGVGLVATRCGFSLKLRRPALVAVIAPPEPAAGQSGSDEWGELLALLADGEAWSSSALALALDVSPRTVLRALGALAAAGKVEPVGRGSARRWMAPCVPGFPTSLLLPAVPSGR